MTELSQTIVKVADGRYEVVGSSGERAGWLERGARKCGWTLRLRSRQPETFMRFADAKAEAIKQSEVY